MSQQIETPKNAYFIPELQGCTMRTVVISDMKISQDIDEGLITYGLGSCVAVMMYDPVHKVGGMLHYLLPWRHDNLQDENGRGDGPSGTHRRADKGNKARNANPFQYGDSGFSLLYEGMLRAGAQRRQLVVRAVGGAVINQTDEKSVGRQNTVALEEMLRRYRLNLAGADLGGRRSRTAILVTGTGQIFIRSKLTIYSL